MKTEQNPGEAIQVSPRLLSLFMAYLHWYMPRHFHSLRIANAERFPATAHPLIVCINHPSWWDPLTILMVSRFLAPERFAYAPMEAEALQQYGFFRKLGAFPVDNTSSQAGRHFLRQSRQVLAHPSAILWMTPEGRFTDVRQRPVLWKRGTVSVSRLFEACTIVPLAIEYTFWDERLPEILCSVGDPVLFRQDHSPSHDARTSALQSAMEQTQDELAARSQKRDAALFTTVFSGDAGVSPIYDLWRRLKFAAQGKPYIAEHGMIAPK
jgi:1-acyl-sn-glycerol-3-phosphate acyltransferase